MTYLERGSGVPVILVHGTISDYRYWTAQIRTLGERFRTIAVSLRRFYPEQWNGEGDDFSLRQHAADLASFIKGLDAGPAHVIGHSRGGDVVLVFASEYRELLRSMILAEPAPIHRLMPKTEEAARGIENSRIFSRAALENLQKGDPEGAIRVFLEGVSGPGAWDKIPDRQRRLFLDNAWSLKSLIPDTEDPLSCADVGGISAPVLLIEGEKSARVYKLMMEGLRPCLRRYEETIIPNAAHAMNQTNQRAFNDAVLGFTEKY